MPTYAQLEQEIWWRNEIVPPNLELLARKLRTRYGVGPNLIGCKGDNRHLRGYHRSRNWVKNSDYCTNRTYSVSRTAGDRSGGDGDWITGMDIGVPRDVLVPMCARLDEAVRAGRLEKVVEWYGNDDGDNRVDGYDNIANQVASSDSSHLYHLHLSFDRGRANEDHDDVFAILTGDDMALTDDDVRKIWSFKLGASGPNTGVALQSSYQNGIAALSKLDAVLAELAEIEALLTAAGGDPDLAPVLAAIEALSQDVAALSTQVGALPDTTELRDAVADLGEGGAAQVRADAD